MSVERIRRIRADVQSALIDLPPAEKVVLARVLYDAIDEYSPGVRILANTMKDQWEQKDATDE